ncbi:MAG: hypothetical protein LC802_12435, partial [Acidobacteria bacterium]|nr:hypothetical protein [Acidobacteriota bacterium]
MCDIGSPAAGKKFHHADIDCQPSLLNESALLSGNVALLSSSHHSVLITSRLTGRRGRLGWLLIFSLLFQGTLYGQEPTKQDVQAAMKRATQFMLEKVSY